MANLSIFAVLCVGISLVAYLTLRRFWVAMVLSTALPPLFFYVWLWGPTFAFDTMAGAMAQAAIPLMVILAFAASYCVGAAVAFIRRRVQRHAP